jgi:hypothetical protein
MFVGKYVASIRPFSILKKIQRFDFGFFVDAAGFKKSPMLKSDLVTNMTLLTNKILIINAPGIKQKAFIGSPLWNG